MNGEWAESDAGEGPLPLGRGDKAEAAAKPDECAMEEWKQVQTIIGRYDGFDFSIRGWLLVLVGAAITARFANNTHLGAGVFLLLAFTAIVALLMSELSFRVVKRRAIVRVFAIEAALRHERKYDGPKISEALSGSQQGIELGNRISAALDERGWRDGSFRRVFVHVCLWFVAMAREMRFPPVLLFYVPVILVVLAASFVDA